MNIAETGFPIALLVGVGAAPLLVSPSAAQSNRNESEFCVGGQLWETQSKTPPFVAQEYDFGENFLERQPIALRA